MCWVQVWSYSQLQEYLNKEHSGQVPDNWVETTLKVGRTGSLCARQRVVTQQGTCHGMGTVCLCLQDRMQLVMLTCFHSVQGKLQRRLGYSDLLGFDFRVDEHFQVLTSMAVCCVGRGVVDLSCCPRSPAGVVD